MALKGRHDGAPWSQWPAPLRRREPAALAAAARELDGELWFWKGVQFLFFRQWEALKARAAEQGVAIIGDLPIYVAEDSADVWADPSQFQMDEALRPTGVAGCASLTPRTPSGTRRTSSCATAWLRASTWPGTART